MQVPQGVWTPFDSRSGHTALAMILAYRLSVQDDDSYMLGDDTHVPSEDRYLFHDWRFGKSGVPHPATCGMCGRKTRADFVDAAFRVKKRRRDVTATYDGYVIVSQRLVDFGLAHACELDGLVELPGDRGFYWFRPSRTLAFAATTSNPCPTCHAFYNVIGPQPVFCQELRGPLAPGFYRSDLEFGSGPEQGPVIVVGAETGDALRRARLSGLHLRPLSAGAIV